jgi:biopolymer transport protein ExbD
VPAIPADDAPTPFAPPTVEAVPVLADESFTPSSPLGPSSPVLQPAGNDPFSAPPAQILPEPAIADDALPLDTFAEPAPPPKALVLVELAANPDGSIKQLRYLTEDLGTDDAAFQQLEKQIVAWAGQFPGGDLTVQVVADPQLRYEHVARITKLCSPLVTRVVLAEAEIKAQVTITVGFVRDAQGRPVVATPVVFWQDEVVRLGELQSRLESWIHSSAQELQKQLGQIAPSQPGALAAMVRDVTLILRCDSSVEYTVVESIMKEARQAGFEHFAIQGIDAADVAFHPVRGVVTEIDRMAGLLRISIGADDGLKPGDELTVNHEQGADDYSSQENIVSRVRVKDVAGDSAWCFILHHDARDPIRAGDMVQTVRSQTANPADNETTD